MKWLLLVSMAILSGFGAMPITARASCAFPPGAAGTATLAAQLEAAPTEFVGMVVSTSNGDRVARVRVESVWKGPAIPTLVTVSGAPDQGSAATSVDRSFAAGRRYLFVPSTSASPFQDSSCSATQLYTDGMSLLKPANAQPPLAGSDGLDPASGAWPWWALAIGVALVGIAAAGAVLWRRRPAG